MTEPLLAALGLTRQVDGRPLWRDVGFEVRAGERLAVTGPSGSGKSVLLRALAGLDAAQAGELRLCGRFMREWPMPQYRATALYLPQRAPPYPGSVEDNLRLAFNLRVHAGKVFSRENARTLLAALGRDSAFLGQDAGRLSGGEAQLVALARALLLGPTVLLLDEATSALDPEATRRAEELLRGWGEAAPQRALIFVSHDAAQRARLATRELDVRDFKAQEVTL